MTWTAADVLNKAADWLEEDPGERWYRGAWGRVPHPLLEDEEAVIYVDEDTVEWTPDNTDMPYCACTAGALHYVGGVDDRGDPSDKTVEALRAFVKWTGSDDQVDYLELVHVIANWNDNDMRTARDVIDALREAAKQCTPTDTTS